MNKERKLNLSPKLWVTIGGIIAAVILAVVLILINRGDNNSRDWALVIPGETGLTGNGDLTDSNGNDFPVESQATEDSKGESATAELLTTETMEPNTNPISTLGEEDPYEDWLATALVISITMRYREFEFLGIYTASETPVAAHDTSAGAYVVFRGDGEILALKAVPLSGERSEKGTADLYVPALGHATYDLVSPDSVPVASLTERKLEDLEELIISSSQVSIIER